MHGLFLRVLSDCQRRSASLAQMPTERADAGVQMGSERAEEFCETPMSMGKRSLCGSLAEDTRECKSFVSLTISAAARSCVELMHMYDTMLMKLRVVPAASVGMATSISASMNPGIVDDTLSPMRSSCMRSKTAGRRAVCSSRGMNLRTAWLQAIEMPMSLEGRTLLHARTHACTAVLAPSLSMRSKPHAVLYGPS